MLDAQVLWALKQYLCDTNVRELVFRHVQCTPRQRVVCAAPVCNEAVFAAFLARLPGKHLAHRWVLSVILHDAVVAHALAGIRPHREAHHRARAALFALSQVRCRFYRQNLLVAANSELRRTRLDAAATLCHRMLVLVSVAYALDSTRRPRFKLHQPAPHPHVPTTTCVAC